MALVEALAGVLLTVLPLLAVIGLWVGSLFDQRFANFVYKLHLLRVGLTHMLFSTDRKWKKQADPEGLPVGEDSESKEVIFVRHGRSAWNNVFNEGFGADFPGRLFGALAREARESVTLDSVFFDSPLDVKGSEQAKSLAKYIEASEPGSIGAVLKGSEGESVIVSSNLRRALSTATICMWERLQRTQEKVHILSNLQEVTFNLDGVALAKPQGSPELADEELAAFGMTKKAFAPERYYNALENDGDKPVKSQGIDRMKDFAAWCFERDEPTIIAAGHSLYFRYFFDTFLANSSTHRSRKDKMENCAVVKFTLHRGRLANGRTWYRIDESSIVADYLGFESKKKKKKKSTKAE